MADTKLLTIRVSPDEGQELERIGSLLYCPPSVLIRTWVAQCVMAKISVGNAKLQPLSSDHKMIQILMPIPLVESLGGKTNEQVYWVVQKTLAAYRTGHLAPLLPTQIAA